jgi:hypothetical protein
MSQINEVVDVSLTISHGGLVSSKSPVAVNDELVLVLSPFKLHVAQELIPAALLHGDAVGPLAERANEEDLISSLAPSEHVVDQISRHLGAWLLLVFRFTSVIIGQAQLVLEYDAAIVGFRIRELPDIIIQMMNTYDLRSFLLSRS